MAASWGDRTLLQRQRSVSIKVILSYTFDWAVLIVVGVVSAILGDLEPHKRPFSLSDPNISLPYAESETVPLWLLGVLIGAFPLITILAVTFIFVPGPTAPRQTPAALCWRRKLWEFHAGTLGFLTAHIIAFFFTQGMKGLFGKPRPDFLDRCQPDLDNARDYVVGGFGGESLAGQLYSASICAQKDAGILDDGFRSYPSGHSSASAAGLVYLSLFLASKLTVGIPYITPGVIAKSHSHVSFPSRMIAADPIQDRLPTAAEPVYGRRDQDDTACQSLRTQAAAPPLYLLAIVLAPFALSIYISASRWFDYRHHGFDILFGYFIGLVPAIFAFRYYHLPISGGAGWAWGPRSREFAFWAGVGRTGYKSLPEEEAASSVKVQGENLTRSAETDSGGDDLSTQRSVSRRAASTTSGPLSSHNVEGQGIPRADGSSRSNLRPHDGGSLAGYYDVEMQRMSSR